MHKSIKTIVFALFVIFNMTMSAQSADDLVKQGYAYAEKGNYTQAALSWQKAAEMGDAEALYKLGRCYSDGQGVAVDLKKSIYYLLKSAKGGFGRASLYLKDMFLTKKDPTTEKYGIVHQGLGGSILIIIPFEYEYVKMNWYQYLNDEPIEAKKNSKWGFIDINNRVVIPFEYEVVGGRFRDGFVRAKKNGKWGIIDVNNKTVIPFEHEDEEIVYFKEGMGKAKKNDKWGIIDVNNKIVFPFEYENIGYPGEGLVRAKKNGKWGFIDKNNRVVIPFEYESYEIGPEFSDGLVRVKKNGKWGFINKDNRIVIPFIYDDAKFFKDGKARVKKDGKWGEINKKNQVVTPFKEEEDDWWR